MDHQWRPRPPPQGNEICPSCSTPHFPFCPPPSSFPTNPNFPYYRDHQRPVFDPYYGSPNPSPYPNPNFQRDPYGNGGFPIQSRHEDYASTPYGNNGFIGSEGDRSSYKRMRVGEGYSSGLVSGSNANGYLNENYQVSSSRVLSDDERRLKLIRDHGNVADGPSPPPPPPPPPPRYDSGVNMFSNDSSYNLDEFRGGRNMEMNRYSDAGSGFVGKNVGFLPREDGLSSGNGIQSDESSGVSDYGHGPWNMPNSGNYTSYDSYYGQNSQKMPYENSINEVQNLGNQPLQHPSQSSGSFRESQGIAKFQPPQPYSAYGTGYMQSDWKQPLRNDVNLPFEGSHLSGQANTSTPSLNDRGSYPPYPSVPTPDTSHPPLPTSPPPPLPHDPPMHIPSGMKSYASPPPSTATSLFPVHLGSAGMVPYHQAAPGSYLSQPSYANKQIPEASNGFCHPVWFF